MPPYTAHYAVLSSRTSPGLAGEHLLVGQQKRCQERGKQREDDARTYSAPHPGGHSLGTVKAVTTTQSNLCLLRKTNRVVRVSACPNARRPQLAAVQQVSFYSTIYLFQRLKRRLRPRERKLLTSGNCTEIRLKSGMKINVPSLTQKSRPNSPGLVFVIRLRRGSVYICPYTTPTTSEMTKKMDISRTWKLSTQKDNCCAKSGQKQKRHPPSPGLTSAADVLESVLETQGKTGDGFCVSRKISVLQSRRTEPRFSRRCRRG
jgi:hypothetical protein